MAATDSFVFVRPRAVASAGNGATGSVSFFAARASTGIYSSRAIGKTNSTGRKVIRPVGVPMVGQDGLPTQAWSDWFVYIEKQFLNMLNGPTLPDVSKYVTTGQATAIANEAVQAGLAQQANANAQSIQTIREVVQTAALPGAMQIPPPKLYSDFTPTPFDSSGGE